MSPNKRSLLRGQGILELHAAILLLGLSGLFGKFLHLAPVLIVFGRAAFACTQTVRLIAPYGGRRTVGATPVAALMATAESVICL